MSRPLGSKNKHPHDIRALAQSFGPAAIMRLAGLSGLLEPDAAAESGQVQVSAMKELLDRGYGRAKQDVDVSGHITLESLIKAAMIEDGSRSGGDVIEME